MAEIMLNLSAWIERRADNLKPYADHIIHSVKAYEAEIERLRCPEVAQAPESDILKEVDLRDHYESAFAEAYALVMGEPIEWSNQYGTEEALKDMDRRLRRERALEPDTVTDDLSKSIADFVSRQEPLGAEFERVLADNIEELYDTDGDESIFNQPQIGTLEFLHPDVPEPGTALPPAPEKEG